MWVEKTPNGKYKACERYTDVLSGKLKKVSVTIEKDTRQARKQAEIALLEKIKTKQTVIINPDITMQELADKYKEWQKKEIKGSSYLSTTRHVEYLIDILGADTIVSNLTAGYVARKIKDGSSSPYMENRNILYFKAMMNWGYDHDVIRERTWIDKIKRNPNKKPIEDTQNKYLEPDELKKLINGIEIESWKLATEFLALSGLRCGEMVALRVSDIDDEGIHVTKTYHCASKTMSSTPKTENSRRVVYIQPELASVISKINTYRKRVMLATGERSDFFIVGSSGKMFSHSGYGHYLKKHSKAICGKEVNPHMLRHTHVSLLAENGVPLDTISRRLGHHDSVITSEIYLHVTEKRKQRDNALISAVKIL